MWFAYRRRQGRKIHVRRYKAATYESLCQTYRTSYTISELWGPFPAADRRAALAHVFQLKRDASWAS